MEALRIEVALCLGFAVAWILAALRHRGSLARARAEEERLSLSRARAEAEAERRDLLARLEERDARMRELREEQCASQERESELRAELQLAAGRCAALEAQLENERRGGAEKVALLEQAQKALSDSFEALSAKALQSNQQSFLVLARESLEKFQQGARSDLDKRERAIVELVKPVRESLDKVDSKLGDLEKARTGAYEGLSQQVRSLLESQNHLRMETGNLVKALRAPAVRGRWGEIQLRRVVEMAGMLAHCDFFEQPTSRSEDGALRPDLLVRLPAGKSVLVDAKAPLSAYLEAVEAPDEETRQLRLKEHAGQVRAHIASLSRKAYWERFEPTPEFVVLFLPSEPVYSAALEQDPSLIETGVGERVLIATPTTLIALLRAVAYGWRQEDVARNAQEIAGLGRELHKRLADMGSHLARLGRSIAGSVDAFNKAVGSMEARVLPSARRFKELQASSPEEIEPLPPIESAPRALQALELTAAQLPEDAN